MLIVWHAQMYHPDKNRAEDATAKFASIAAAWERIGTPDARAVYDDFGENSEGFDTYAEFKEHQAKHGTAGKTSSDFYQGEEFVTRLTVWK